MCVEVLLLRASQALYWKKKLLAMHHHSHTWTVLRQTIELLEKLFA